MTQQLGIERFGGLLDGDAGAARHDPYRQPAVAAGGGDEAGVGTEVAWKSETRPNVTGKSKVTGQEALADGSQCVTVNDVVIVDGEETTVPKRMCRRPGASGYARV